MQPDVRTRLTIPPDPRNTGPGAVLMPCEIGEVYPFRYAEIEHASDVDAAQVHQIRVHYLFDDDASTFSSSDPILNEVWDLCKYTIKATSFAGVYVDGDRERIPYEGDAYINQLCHYCVDSEYDLARYSHEYLLHHPTWPTEWQMHSVLMAWADHLYTGETASLVAFYDLLCAKTLIALAREDGLISTASTACTRAFEESLGLYHSHYIFDHGLRDLVDWPPGAFTQGGQGERDNHEMLPINTVVNAFHYRALVLMGRIARALGKSDDSAKFEALEDRVHGTFNAVLFDPDRGVYVDGEGSEHASLHSNMFALAFGLVPTERLSGVIEYVKSRGMACSVYGAQYLLEALYRHGEADYALDLMTARQDRGWWHMAQSGSTMTMEAWDHKYKNNLDWNHAWGAVPANIIARYVLGVRPLAPGFAKLEIQPQLGGLKMASGKVPTPLGPVTVEAEGASGELQRIDATIPDGAVARLVFPESVSGQRALFLNGKKIVAGIHPLGVCVDVAGPNQVSLSSP